MRKKIVSFFIASLLTSSWAISTEAKIAEVDSLLDTLANNMESTLIGKDDAPLAASGYMVFRVKNFEYPKASGLQSSDLARTAVDALFQMSIVGMPNSYLTLWTNLAFPFDLSGFYANHLSTRPSSNPSYKYERVLFDHSTDYNGPTVNEEMNVGVDIRAGVFGAYVTAGGVIWANASPLTMWERETSPRFLSQYELFEEEKTVSTYYKEKSFKPVKEGGRAFWTNRSFGGVFVNFYQLPMDLKAQFMLSQPADMDPGTRDGLTMFGGQPSELEMFGDYTFRGDVYHARLAKEKIAGDMIVGVNYLGMAFDKAIVYEPEFYSQWVRENMPPTLLNTHVASIDFKGNINSKFYLMADLALSITDSSLFNKVPPPPGRRDSSYEKTSYDRSVASPEFGVYVKAQSKHIENVPITLEGIYFSKDFFSPYSITNPSRFPGWRKDEFYLNSGSLRYAPNLTGLNLKVEPVFNRGRLDLQYGQHRQVKEGNDVLLFNYRLNGRAMWESTNSWTKHNPLFWADSGNGIPNGYVERVGVLSEDVDNTGIKMYRQQGGLRGGTWELWETFVAYENIDQVKQKKIPSHTKWSSYLSIDAGYDIGHWFNTDRDIMMAGHAAVSGVSTTIAPLAYSESQSGMLLWSFYGQFEPAVAITPNLHMVGIFGLETWRSNHAYVARDLESYASNGYGVGKSHDYYSLLNGYTYIEKAPINYLQTAVGFGFDWDFSDRVGLHMRYKWMTHSDETVSENDWSGHYITAETKMWF